MDSTDSEKSFIFTLTKCEQEYSPFFRILSIPSIAGRTLEKGSRLRPPLSSEGWGAPEHPRIEVWE